MPIFIDEHDAGGFEGGADGAHGLNRCRWNALSGLKPLDRWQADARDFGELPGGPTDQCASGADLGGRDHDVNYISKDRNCIDDVCIGDYVNYITTDAFANMEPAMRDDSATIPPCPPPGAAVHAFPGDQARSARPPAWELVREPLYVALRERGLTEAAAFAAAERGADAAIVDARLVTLAEARRWGRPLAGTPAIPAAPPAAHGIPADVMNAFAEFENQIRTMAALARVLVGMYGLRRFGGVVADDDIELMANSVNDGAQALEAQYDEIWAMARTIVAGQQEGGAHV